MFAKLETPSAGLVKATVRPKNRRTNTGCSECRRRKKKCDEEKPVCGNCLRYTGRAELKCTWSTGTHSATKSSPTPPSGSSSKDDSGQLQLLSHAEADVSSHGANHSATELALSPQSQTALLPSSLSASFASQPEQQALQFLHANLRNLLTPIDATLHVFDLTIPVATTSLVLKNAYVASGLAFIAMKDSNAERKILAAEYYGKTLRIIRKGLIDPPQEDVLSAMLLVNFTEEMQSSVPNPAHIRGTLALLPRAIPKGLPYTIYQHILLESCIITLLMSTRPPFSEAVYQSLPDTMVSSLLKALKTGSQELWPGPLWRHSAYLGISHDFFDIAFRLAQLRRRLPLDIIDQFKLTKLDVRLTTWCVPELGSPPIGLKLTATLFHLACSLFLYKISQPSLQAHDDLLVRPILQKAIKVIAQIPVAQLAAPVMAWPLLILAFGAWTDQEKRALRSPFEYQESHYSMGNATKALGLIKFIWTLDGSKEGLYTLDGLVSDKYLAFVPF